jgi:hypothetical protein
VFARRPVSKFRFFLFRVLGKRAPMNREQQERNNEMTKNNKVSMKQLRDATDVLMRFLEESQTVNPQNSDAIVEYEGSWS